MVQDSAWHVVGAMALLHESTPNSSLQCPSLRSNEVQIPLGPAKSEASIHLQPPALLPRGHRCLLALPDARGFLHGL